MNINQWRVSYGAGQEFEATHDYGKALTLARTMHKDYPDENVQLEGRMVTPWREERGWKAG